MTASRKIFADLNDYRVAAGLKPLTSLKMSTASMIAAIKKFDDSYTAPSFEATPAELAAQTPRQEIVEERAAAETATPVVEEVIAPAHPRSDVSTFEGTADPKKTARLKAARTAAAATETHVEPAAKPTKKSTDKAIVKSKTIVKTKTDAKATAATRAGFSAAKLITEFGLAPKVGRALLRKHAVAKTPEAVRAFFTSRKK